MYTSVEKCVPKNLKKSILFEIMNIQWQQKNNPVYIHILHFKCWILSKFKLQTSLKKKIVHVYL